MKVIYIAGPYRSDCDNGVFENIIHARGAAQRLWHEGWAVVCPAMNSAFMSEGNDDSIFLQGDLEILARCDAVYLLSGWAESRGAQAELELAQSLDLEVIYE